MYYCRPMRTSETVLNKKVTIQMNDREYREFRTLLLMQGKEVSKTLREMIRDYVKAHKKNQPGV